MVRRIAKTAARLLWRATAPLRRPLRRKLDARVEALVADAIHARMMPAVIDVLAASDRRLDRIEQKLASANLAASAIADELEAVLGGVYREVSRLQARVEDLREIVEDCRLGAPAGLSIVDEAGDGAPVLHPIAAERSKVG